MAAAMLAFAACDKTPKDDPKPDPKPDPEPDPTPVYVAPITIDGNFEDWATLDASKVASAKSDPESPWDAIKEIRVYADEMYVFYYIEYDKAQISTILEEVTGEDVGLPIRLNINTDGEFTSGYASYSLDAYDFILEGSLAEEKAWKSFDPTFYQRIDGWQELLASGNGITSGAGKDNKYEIQLLREIFNSAASTSAVPMPMGEVFQTGIRFYTAGWKELGNLPDGAVTEENAKGWGHLLNVTTVMQ